MKIRKYYLLIGISFSDVKILLEKVFVIMLISLFASSCSANRTSASSDMGVLMGVVVLSEGNQMPNNQLEESSRGVSREVLIYELTNVSDAQESGQLYSSINSKVLKRTKTNAKGEFKVKLTEGKYSVVIKEGEGYYINQFDKENNIHPVLIETGKTTKTTVTINYNASY